jgi:ARG and Rhodanese-Phosphatase-superfamily-associated Protein domain
MCRTARLALFTLSIGLISVAFQPPARTLAGNSASGLKALAPITEGNLTVFPVVTDFTHDTSRFITLDQGLQSGAVVVTEEGRQGLIRPQPQDGHVHPELLLEPQASGAQVNRLVLVNHSSRPLILLAGEIVTGGKQDRVVAKDRIVPVQSDPIDLDVFCVEPHRWTPHGEFVSRNAPIAQPSIRREVMVQRDQTGVWARVGGVIAGAAAAAPPPAAAQMRITSSYAAVMENPAEQDKLRQLTTPIERSYERLREQLRAEKAVGVVAAVNGRIIWADIFASPELFDAYWPKLVLSYAAEAVTTEKVSAPPGIQAAQAFLDDWQGSRSNSESEASVYRTTEITGGDFTAFRLTSLLPHTDFDVHDAKMAR